MRRSPNILHVLATHVSLLRNLLVVLCRMVSLRVQLSRWAGLCSIRICWSGDFLPRTRAVSIVSQTKIVLVRRKSNHRKRNNSSWAHRYWQYRLTLRMASKMRRSIAVNNLAVMAKHRRSISSGFCGGCVSGLRPSRSLFACEIVLSKTLLSCFRFPIIVSNSSSIYNHSATELAKHGLGRHNRYLT